MAVRGSGPNLEWGPPPQVAAPVMPAAAHRRSPVPTPQGHRSGTAALIGVSSYSGITDAMRARAEGPVTGLRQHVGSEGQELLRREHVVDRAPIGGVVEVMHHHRPLVAHPTV